MYGMPFPICCVFKLSIYIVSVMQCLAIVKILYLVISPYSFSIMSVTLSDMTVLLHQVEAQLSVLQSIDLNHVGILAQTFLQHVA